MNLEEYRRATGVSYTHIAKVCGVSPAAISLIAGGYQKPGFDLALRIETATNNGVGRENWYPPRPAPISITVGTSV
jgi:transcriptional regulator with XRE-family HTH domain